MHRIMFPQLELSQAFMGYVGAFTLWVADTVTPVPEGWLGVLRELGLPTAMVAVLIWAYRKQSQDLKESQDKRVEDAKEHAAQYKEIADKSNSLRDELIRETREQTRAIKEK